MSEQINEVKEEIKNLEGIIKAIDDRIAGRVESDIKSYEVESDLGKRRVEKLNFNDLMKARNTYRGELRRAKAKLKNLESDKPKSRMVLVRL